MVGSRTGTRSVELDRARAGSPGGCQVHPNVAFADGAPVIAPTGNRAAFSSVFRMAISSAVVGILWLSAPVMGAIWASISRRR